MTTADLSLGRVLPRNDDYSIIRPSAARNSFGRRWSVLQAFADFLAVVAGICFSYWVYIHFGIGRHVRYHISEFVLVTSCIGIVCVLIFRHLHLYDLNVSLLNIREIENLLRGIVIVFAGVVIYFFFDRPEPISRWLILVCPPVVTILLLSERNISLICVRWMHQRGYGARRVIVYGTSYAAHIVRMIRRNPRLGLVCVGLVGENVQSLLGYMADNDIEANVLGEWDELEEIVGQEEVDEIIVADPSIARDKLLQLIASCNRLGLGFSVVPDLFGPYNQWFRYELVDGVPLARCRQAAISMSGRVAKRLFDILIASALVLLLSPFFLVIAILVRLDSRGPVLFRQKRVGKDGKLFEMLKFRSMSVDAPKYAQSPVGHADPRITRIGRILRRTSLDEIPQLLNVLLGDMSLVGPRPEMPFIVADYGPVERGRLRVQPGITGLWQISPARAESIHKNIEYDLFYIEHQNVFLDVAILLYTGLSVVRGVGAY